MQAASACGALVAIAATLLALAGAGAGAADSGHAGHDATAPARDSAAAPGGPEIRIDLPDFDSGKEMIGRPAPEWAFTRWAHGGPLAIGDLRGRVVLMRFWTEHCRFCRATLPAIERLRAAHARDGLVVIGAFHPPRPGEPCGNAHVLRVARELGFDGPVAVDRDWKTLGRWWLDGHPERSWVSISFLIDREGVIRWVHGGGEYHPGADPRHARCDLEYRELETALAELLAEPAAAH